MPDLKKKYTSAGTLVNKGEVLFAVGHDEYGVPILDIFGNFLEPGGDPVEGVRARLNEMEIPYTSISAFGEITNLIHKPEGDVELHIGVCKVDISDEGRQQLVGREGFEWLNEKQIEEDERVNRVREIAQAAYRDEPFNHVWEEDQMTSWRDAKTLRWEENKQNTWIPLLKF